MVSPLPGDGNTEPRAHSDCACSWQQQVGTGGGWPVSAWCSMCGAVSCQTKVSFKLEVFSMPFNSFYQKKLIWIFQNKCLRINRIILCHLILFAYIELIWRFQNKWHKINRSLLCRLSQHSVWLQTGWQGFEPWQRQRIFPLARPALRPTQPPIQLLPEFLPWGKSTDGA
jgi:hypothetical protein